uniref:C2H2-type domain-containing protein n=1 Tax=Cannabis sativa TaxID=3483 RepID=A0A803NY47_CANSA
MMLFQQQEERVVAVMDENNMSNLTSAASGDQTSVSSSGNRAEIGTNNGFSHQYFASPPPHQSQPPPKKKRNLPGNPDPDAEVIALSPKTLMATNRFICEICNKGFQRDQNLQLHRRGHNLPWKLKQRTSKEVKKKVYVCPEASCVHHEPSRALGDLTGIKKHFCRKHGEKKWKCDKCSKRYAVQSDWKAHSKTCGTREYRSTSPVMMMRTHQDSGANNFGLNLSSRDHQDQTVLTTDGQDPSHLGKTNSTAAAESGGGVGGNGNHNGEGLTRDFLGLRPLSHTEMLNMAALGNTINMFVPQCGT